MSAITRLRAVVKQHPLISNMLVCSGLYYAGDMSRQTIQKVEHYETQNANNMALYGGAVAAPVMYNWYKVLDKWLPKTDIRTVLVKAAIDQAICGLGLAYCFYISMSVLEKQEDVFEEARSKAFKTFLVGCGFWPVAQTINFTFLPSHMRTVYVAACSFIWTNVLSFLKSQPTEPDQATVMTEKT